MYFRIAISVFLLFCGLYADDSRHNKTQQIAQKQGCQIVQECRVGICLYECLEDDIIFNRFTVYGVNIHEAYAVWLELVGGVDYLLLDLPQENQKYSYNEQVIVEYKWHTPQHISILLQEKDVIVGELIIKQRHNEIIIDDKIMFIR